MFSYDWLVMRSFVVRVAFLCRKEVILLIPVYGFYQRLIVSENYFMMCVLNSSAWLSAKWICKMELLSLCLSNSLVVYIRFYILPVHCCSVVVSSWVLYFRPGVQIVSCTLPGDSVLFESTGLLNPILCFSQWKIFWKKISKSDCVFRLILGQQENNSASTCWLQEAFPKHDFEIWLFF